MQTTGVSKQKEIVDILIRGPFASRVLWCLVASRPAEKLNAAISQSSKDDNSSPLTDSKGHFVAVVRLGVGLTLGVGLGKGKGKSDGLTTSAPISDRCTMHSTCLFFLFSLIPACPTVRGGRVSLRLRVRTYTVHP